MIKLNVPKEFNKLENEALHVVQYVGRHGFTRSEYFKSGAWKAGQEVWVDNDSTKVEWVAATTKVVQRICE